MIILVLMAGMGTRTASVSEGFPKPLIKIHQHHLIELVLLNFKLKSSAKYIFVVQQELLEKHDLTSVFRKFGIDFEFVALNGPNEGAIISALAAKEHYKNQELLIVNSDQFLTKNIQHFIYDMRAEINDGAILTMFAEGPKWSYVVKDEKNIVSRVAEKIQISNDATIGAYWFRNGNDFIHAANLMIQANDRTNNEFYLAPVYNYLISANKKIRAVKIEDYQTQFFGLGTSEDITKARENIELKNIISQMSAQ